MNMQSTCTIVHCITAVILNLKGVHIFGNNLTTKQLDYNLKKTKKQNWLSEIGDGNKDPEKMIPSDMLSFVGEFEMFYKFKMDHGREPFS